jgi:hypothetical protein
MSAPQPIRHGFCWFYAPTAPDDDLVARGDFRRQPGTSVDALKTRIERQHRTSLMMLHATYSEPA